LRRFSQRFSPSFHPRAPELRTSEGAPVLYMLGVGLNALHKRLYFTLSISSTPGPLMMRSSTLCHYLLPTLVTESFFFKLQWAPFLYIMTRTRRGHRHYLVLAISMAGGRIRRTGAATGASQVMDCGVSELGSTVLASTTGPPFIVSTFSRRRPFLVEMHVGECS
jgi:hypothetical protein